MEAQGTRSEYKRNPQAREQRRRCSLVEFVCAIALALAVFSPDSRASICFVSDPEEELQQSQLLFLGTPYWVSPFSDVAYIKVHEVYKGVVPEGLLKVRYRGYRYRSNQPSTSFGIGFTKVIRAMVLEGRQGQEVFADACWQFAVRSFPEGWQEVFARYRKQHEALVAKASSRASDPASWYALAASESAAQDWLQLQSTAAYLTRLQLRSAEPLLLLGTSLAGLGHWNKALQAYQAALALAPKSISAKKGIEQTHIDQGQ